MADQAQVKQTEEKAAAAKENAQDGDVVSEVTTQSPYHLTIDENLVKNRPELAEKARWYVVHTYSGHEVKVAQTLSTRVRSMGLTDQIFELLVPTQDKIQIKKGQKKTVKEKIFPGYMLLKMIVTDASWLAVRTTQGITGFIGTGKNPTPISEKEVQAIMKFMKMEAPKYKSAFSLGEAVKIVEGPFADFLGTVDKIDEEKGKIHVLVSIFGRETPVELDFLQVSKI